MMSRSKRKISFNIKHQNVAPQTSNSKLAGNYCTTLELKPNCETQQFRPIGIYKSSPKERQKKMLSIKNHKTSLNITQVATMI